MDGSFPFPGPVEALLQLPMYSSYCVVRGQSSRLPSRFVHSGKSWSPPLSLDTLLPSPVVLHLALTPVRGIR